MTRAPVSPIGLDELSAYVDGELPRDRRAAVDEHLAKDADNAARVALYRRHDDDLRQALAPLAEAGLTRSLEAALSQDASRRRRSHLRIAAAAALLLVVAGAAGWWYHAERARALVVAGLVHRAAVAHLSYMAAPASDGAAPALLTERLRRIVGRGAAPPDLAEMGYEWAGGALLGPETAPALLLVYRNGAGDVVSCYYDSEPSAGETQYRVTQSGAITIVYRLDEGVGYAVVGAATPDVLTRIAEMSYRADAD